MFFADEKSQLREPGTKILLLNNKRAKLAIEYPLPRAIYSIEDMIMTDESSLNSHSTK